MIRYLRTLIVVLTFPLCAFAAEEEIPTASPLNEETVGNPITGAGQKPVSTLPGPGKTNAPPSPVAVDEARELFESGVEAFGKQNYVAASEIFEKLLRVYPSNAYRLEAHFYLGQTRFQAGQFAAAIAPLQSAIGISGRSPIANEARVLLGNSYLEISKFSEAYQVSEELLQQPGIRSTLRGKSLLMRAQAQVGLKQIDESEKSFTVFQLIADQDPELERELARSYLVSLLVKSAECDRLPSSDALPEDQLMDQLNRKALCVLEMGALFSRSARTLPAPDLKSGSDLVFAAYRSYAKQCAEPPLAKAGRTDAQWKTARQELTQNLKDPCQSTFQLLMESLKERDSAQSLRNSLTTPLEAH